MPAVSIITPFLNAEPYLAQAIDSVRAQTVADWELILVDDGSSDGSAAIASAAATGDTRIRFLVNSGRNHGAAAARNYGISAAKADFVAFLDADDLFEPDKLEADLRAFEKSPEAAMVYGPTLWWFPGSERNNWAERMGNLAGRLHAPPDLVGRVMLRQRGNVPCTCSILVRRDALNAVGGFEETFRLYEDQTLLVKLMLRYPVFVRNEPKSRYRQHAASTSAGATAAGVYDRNKPHAARAEFLKWVGEHAASSGLMTAELARALRFALARYPEFRLPLSERDRFDLAIDRLRILAHKFRPRQVARLAWKLLKGAR